MRGSTAGRSSESDLEVEVHPETLGETDDHREHRGASAPDHEGLGFTMGTLAKVEELKKWVGEPRLVPTLFAGLSRTEGVNAPQGETRTVLVMQA
jgi:hypothetical protein